MIILHICFPISRKSLTIFTVILLIILAIPYIFLTYLISSKENTNTEIDDSFLENSMITGLIDKESKSKEIIAKYKGKKVIALTFDDGPSKYTEKLLDILNEKDVKATFFLLGYKLDNRIDTVRRMASEGHDIGIHGYTHKLFTKLTEEEINYEIETSRDIIENIIKDKVELIRVPYGAVNSLTIDAIKKHELTNILWNIDSKDWKLRNCKKVTKRVVNSAKDKKIILMHDTYLPSVNAASEIIDKLKEEDFYFVTVTELLILKNCND